MKTMILLVLLGMIAMACCQDCTQRGLDIADCVSSLVCTISCYFFLHAHFNDYMQVGDTATDITQFCNDCADDLRSFYNDCPDGPGASSVDLRKLNEL